jgi:hypothetical protein
MSRPLVCLVTLSSVGEAKGGMPSTLARIARLDRRWFLAHRERRHRCRWPDTVEVDLYDSDRGARLVMTIRHLGRGHIVYQPVIFQGDLPRDEGSAAALFALAAISSEPVPVLSQMDVLRLRRRAAWLPHREVRASLRGAAERRPAVSSQSPERQGS